MNVFYIANRPLNNFKSYPLNFKGDLEPENVEYPFNPNKTAFLRDDLKWDILFNYLCKKYANEKKVNVYDYACSSGAESFTISILIQEMEKNPNKFFPIIAKDIDKGIIGHTNYNKSWNDCHLYESNGYKKIKYYLPGLDYTNEYFNVNCDYFFDTIKFKNKTTSKIDFSYGDILDDVDKIDNKNPSIIFMRNMWVYVDKSKYDNFAKDLYKRLKKGSSVIIGYYDIQDDNENKRRYSIKDALINAGFKPKLKEATNNEIYTKSDYLVYEK